jgi:[histone H3]-lysine36 N-trimethyltransferase
MNKYKAKIPREDLKRFAKEIAKKLVESDFKSGRVEDPTKISDKHQQKVKKYCKDFFEKAAYKHSKHEKEKAAKKAISANGSKTDSAGVSTATSIAPSPTQKWDASPDMDVKKEDESDDEDVKMSEDEPEEAEKPASASSSPNIPNGDTLKRKRSRSEDRDVKEEDDLTKSPLKKLNLDSPPPPPPPPPAPPIETPDGTPRQSEDASPAEVSLHADTSFKSKSMADVLAEAQQDNGDEADVPMEDANTSFENGLKENCLVHQEEMLDDPVVEGQIKEEVAA